MSTALHIAQDLALPLEAVTQSFAILAKRGSGKTYTAAVFIEELLKAGLPVVAVDPVGVLWGLRAAADGVGAGLPVVILGGEHGDLPLAETDGAAVAETVAAEGLSCVLDLSLFRKGETVRFLTDFAETLYRRNRKPLHLVLDEADVAAPQRPQPGEQRLLGAVEDLVRRGRARGIGVTLITQRPAVLNKNVLTQAEVLIALRLIAPQDRSAIDEWIRVHGTPEQREELMASLPSLPIGQAWIWSPGWLDLFRRVTIRRRETFDSSATPKVGERIAAPKALAPVDLERLRGKLSAVIEKAKAEDPRTLRQRIAELERQVAAKPAAAPRVERIVERVEVPVLDARQVEQLGELTDGLRSVAMRLIDVADEIKTALGRAGSLPQAAPRPLPPRSMQPTSQPAQKSKLTHSAAPAGDAKLGGAERKILTALAQYPDGRTKVQVALLTGYAHSGGGFNNALGALRSKGYISGRGNESLQATEDGLAALGEWEPLPMGQALLEYWYGQLGKAERLILEWLASIYPNAASKEAVAEATGYAVGGGGFGNALGRLRTLELIEGRGELRAADTLFAEASKYA